MLEATGNYSSLLVYILSRANITGSLENPLKIKNFARVMLSVTKTNEDGCTPDSLAWGEDAAAPLQTS